MSSSNSTLDLTQAAASRALVTRDQGRSLLLKAEAALELGALHVDLDKAESMSPSFADEFFGGLIEKLGSEKFSRSVRVRCSNETWQVLIKKVIGHRQARPKWAGKK